MSDNDFRKPGSNPQRPAQHSEAKKPLRQEPRTNQPSTNQTRPNQTANPNQTKSTQHPLEALAERARNGFGKMKSSLQERSTKSRTIGKQRISAGSRMKSTPQSNRQSFDEKRKAYDEERRERIKRRELFRIKRNVRKRVSGKPHIPNNHLTVPGILGKFAGKVALLVAIILVVAILFVGGTGIGIVVGYISTANELSSDLFVIEEQTTHIYDANAVEIASLTGSSNINRELVPYADVSPTYIDEAFMAIEDRSFDENIGIDPRRIISAVVGVVTSSGESAHGGSTITQQTVKMLTGDDEVSYQRKVQEWFRAVKLTDQLSKSEIMGLYLNLVPMGNNFVGIQSAAKAYFGKEASELNLAESALLAGIPKSPSSYNPRTELGRKNAQRRQRVVLQAMLQEEMITPSQFEAAMNYELIYNQETIRQTGTAINSYFEEYAIAQVIADLIEQKGYSENIAYRMVMNGGLQIHTTVDTAIQNRLDDYFSNIEYFQTDPSDYVNSPEAPQAGVAVVNNRSNTIVALQGGYGPKTANLVLNRATGMRRQPASAIKPLAVYAPAMQLGIATPATMIRDEEVFMDPRRPDEAWPTNSYDSYYGIMNLIDCLKISNNVPAVKLLAEVGVANSKYYMKQMGIDLFSDPVQLSLATGGLTYGTSPLQMADAFSTLPNGGLYAPAKSYSQVLDSNGTVLLENTADFTQVFKPETAYQVQMMMEEVLRTGTGGTTFRGTANGVGEITNAQGERIAASAKTGTSNGRKDEWMVMQTPLYTSVGWYGFDNRLKQTFIEWKDFYHIHNLIGDFMKDIHAEEEAMEWNKPAGIVSLEICSFSGQLATPGCGNRTRTLHFDASSDLVPKVPCGIHSNSGSPINFFHGDAR